MPARALLPLLLALTLAACGGTGDDDPADPTDDGADPVSGTEPAEDGESAAAAGGEIGRYGTLTVADDGGEASDAVAAFFRIETRVAPDAFDALAPDAVDCRVRSDDTIGFEEISSGFVARPSGAEIEPIGAGAVLLLSSPAGSYVELQPQQVGGFTFYDPAPGQALSPGPVPNALVADIAGGEFPGFVAVEVPDVEPLEDVGEKARGTITRDTRFTWRAGSNPNAKLRILAATAGGFFLDDGVTLSCTVPDSGEFVFPPNVRAALGAGFEGGAPTLSRVAIRTERREDALLILVRESVLP